MLDLDGLNPDKIIKILDIKDEGQPDQSQKIVRQIMKELGSKKKIDRFRILFERYSGDPFWKTRIRSSDTLSISAD